MQTAINPALAAAMTLERAAQVGEFQPMTRDGQPTVAAQLMQKAAPPAIPDVVQQAGLGGQIQAMQMQDAQKELISRLMAQQRQSAGLEGLNPQMGNFAEGGIVGYAGGGMPNPLAWLLERLSLPTRGGATESPMEAKEKEDALKAEAQLEQETRRFSQDVPYASVNAPVTVPPPAPPRGGIQTLPAAQKVAAPRPTEGLASSSKEDIDAMQKIGRELAAIPASPDPQKNTELAMQKKVAADEFARQTGNDPDMVLKQIAQYEDMYRRRDEQLARRMADLDANKREQGLIEFLLGARGMKGEGIGTVFGSGARASRAYEAQTRAQMERMEELRMDLESAKADRVNALRKFKYETDMGHYKSAEQERQNALEAQRKAKMIELEIAKTTANIRSEEARVRAQVESSAADRAASRQQGLDQKDQQALGMNLQRLEVIEKDVDSQFKDDPRVSAYRALQLSKAPIPPEIQKGYDQAKTDRALEISRRSAAIMPEIQRLYMKVHGRPMPMDTQPAPGTMTSPPPGAVKLVTPR